MAQLHEAAMARQARHRTACSNRRTAARNRFPRVRSRKTKMDKGGVVREMFDRIAGRYDLTNTVMTGGIDALWRRRAIAMLDVEPGARVLDLCCGTGVMTRDVAAKVIDGSVVGVDFSPAMLAVARRNVTSPSVEFLEADALHLPFADASFDGATMGFSMRNLVDIGAGLREITRVLKPGATFVNLEIAKPPNPIWRRLFYIHFYGIVPLVGRVVGRDAAAYRYLPQSLVNFPDADVLAGMFAAAGFEHVRYVRMMGGIVTLHAGSVPALQAKNAEAMLEAAGVA
jgi:demethylmenaquinone methyltransferase/2-methoxy-6-polyprenyl-1,4-benzoquinol methylase